MIVPDLKVVEGHSSAFTLKYAPEILHHVIVGAITGAAQADSDAVFDQYTKHWPLEHLPRKYRSKN